jgi:DNA-binding NarL/FixJ family response regulator
VVNFYESGINKSMGKVRILLADDHEVVRAGIRKVVEEDPDRVVVSEVGDGPSLLACLDRDQFDCLIIDIRMPDFDPISAVTRIRTLYPAIKILVVSAFKDDVYVQGLLGAGVNGYHLKDQPLSDLRLALTRVLAGERWVSGPLISRLVSSIPSSSTLSILTNRQREVLHFLQEGCDNQAIAREMGLSVKTIENHLTRIYKHLRIQSRLEAVNYLNQHPELLGVIGQEVNQNSITHPNHKGLSILLVDDNTRYLNQLQHVLGKVYPQAILYEAQSIATSVQIAQTIKPELIFVDVVLGEQDGINCIRRLKAISLKSRIIAISAYPDREFHRLSLEAGAVAFLDKKDLDAVTLHQVIEDVIS